MRTPWWAHNAVEEQLALPGGSRFKPCRDGCGGRIIVVRGPRGADGKTGAFMPLEKIGEKPNEADPTKMVGVYVIHHDNCSNPRVPGNRDPSRSHRIAVNEDKPEIPDEQERFRLHRLPASTEG